MRVMACMIASVLECSESQLKVTAGIGDRQRRLAQSLPSTTLTLTLTLTALTLRQAFSMAGPCTRARAAANMLRSTRPSVASSSRALFSTSTRRLAEPAPAPASESPDSSSDGADAVTPVVEEAPAASAPIASGQKNGYRAWLTGEGSRYRRPLAGKPNWIGDTVSTSTWPSTRDYVAVRADTRRTPIRSPSR